MNKDENKKEESKKKTNKMLISKKEQFIADFSDVEEDKMKMARIKATRRVITFTFCKGDEIVESVLSDGKVLYEVTTELSKIEV